MTYGLIFQQREQFGNFVMAGVFVDG